MAIGMLKITEFRHGSKSYSLLMTNHSIINLKSPFPFAETVQRLVQVFATKGIKVFATIDQQAEAQSVGLDMPPTTLIIFGNPRAGTPLMLANPVSGVDLPLKVLIHEDKEKSIMVSFTSAQELIKRYSLPEELTSNLIPAERLIQSTLGYRTDN